MKIGLVQTQRFGDLVIALPIARWFIRHGHQVFWPIHPSYMSAMNFAEPAIEFLPVEAEYESVDYFYDKPERLLAEAGCERVFHLYLYPDKVTDAQLAVTVKFDEYKYAITDVPFAEKWNLALRRDPDRELALYNSLGITREYVLVHDTGSNFAASVTLPTAWLDRYQVVTIDRRTDNPFDWIHTIEKASKRVFLDSVFANLTDQLNIVGDNHLILRSVINATPVLKNGWQFCWPGEPIVERPPWAPAPVPA